MNQYWMDELMDQKFSSFSRGGGGGGGGGKDIQ